MQKQAPKIKLNNGQEMPVLGLGTWRSYESDAEEAVKAAINVGYRHIDSAYVYENEAEVGAAIRKKIEEGVIKRKDIFVVSKLAGIHHDPKLVEHACRKSLSNFGLDYIDQYLMHFPIGQEYCGDENVHGSGVLSNVDYLDTWHAMEELVSLGLVRGIGLSNFNAAQTQRVLDNCHIKPVVNQVECHPGFNQKQLIEFSKERGIVITAYCPLARPRPEQKWPPFIYDEKAQNLAKKYGKTSAQVCLRYLIQCGVVPLPKSVRPARIAENFDVFDFELSVEDMQEIDSYHNGRRTIPFTGFRDHQYYPFNDKF